MFEVEIGIGIEIDVVARNGKSLPLIEFDLDSELLDVNVKTGIIGFRVKAPCLKRTEFRPQT